jgi:hypothetical protein
MENYYSIFDYQNLQIGLANNIFNPPTCTEGSDCFTNVCNATNYCEACSNTIQGKYCANAICSADSDCLANKCTNGLCVACNEIDGNYCNGSPCALNSDCSTGVCMNSVCTACDD